MDYEDEIKARQARLAANRRNAERLEAEINLLDERRREARYSSDIPTKTVVVPDPIACEGCAKYYAQVQTVFEDPNGKQYDYRAWETKKVQRYVRNDLTGQKRLLCQACADELERERRRQEELDNGRSYFGEC